MKRKERARANAHLARFCGACGNLLLVEQPRLLATSRNDAPDAQQYVLTHESRELPHKGVPLGERYLVHFYCPTCPFVMEIKTVRAHGLFFCAAERLTPHRPRATRFSCLRRGQLPIST